jgi:predicted enzyme related to lactoylglutathione lyase
MTHPVVWFEVLGEDGAKLQRFYGELFNWKIDAANPMKYGMVTTGEPKRGISGGVGTIFPGTKSWVTFYVRSQDVTKTLAAAEKLGGKILMPRKELPAGPPIGMFQDPEGHIIGLVEEAVDAPA